MGLKDMREVGRRDEPSNSFRGCERKTWRQSKCNLGESATYRRAEEDQPTKKPWLQRGMFAGRPLTIVLIHHQGPRFIPSLEAFGDIGDSVG